MAGFDLSYAKNMSDLSYVTKSACDFNQAKVGYHGQNPAPIGKYLYICFTLKNDDSENKINHPRSTVDNV